MGLAVTVAIGLRQRRQQRRLHGRPNSIHGLPAIIVRAGSAFAAAQPQQQQQQQSQPHFGPTSFGYNRAQQGRHPQQPQTQPNAYPHQGQQQHRLRINHSNPNTYTPQPNTYQHPPAVSGPGAGYQQQQPPQHQARGVRPLVSMVDTLQARPCRRRARISFSKRTSSTKTGLCSVAVLHSTWPRNGVSGPVHPQQQMHQQQYRQPQQSHGYGQTSPSSTYPQAPVSGQHRQQFGQQQQMQQMSTQQQQPPSQHQQQQQQQAPLQPTGSAPGMYPGYPQTGFVQYQPQVPGSQPLFVPPPSQSGHLQNPGQTGPNPQTPQPMQQQNQLQQLPLPPHMMHAVPAGFMPIMPQPMSNQPFPPPPHMQFMPHMAMQVPFPVHMPIQMQVPMQPQPQAQPGPRPPQFATPQFQGPIRPSMQQPPMMFMAPGIQPPPYYPPGPMPPPPIVPPPASTSPVTNPPFQANRQPGAASPNSHAGPSTSQPQPQPQHSNTRASGPPIAGNSVSIDTLDSVLERIKSTLAKPHEESTSTTGASPTVSLNAQQQPASSATTPTTATRDFALDLGPPLFRPR
ncbi:hypothetical protein BCR44DRAFT_1205328 [Catenaria anguillulae PL171]|uniref:Uncharacterized protein n=1 Tax=Catenaria anguillulae PL171 TaxID=765915 RepID=A0A1Y2HF52_9FUNG|nr:hypothetical protein BCR44DRAFT_1205328 [Catenaria anguillulae PL171]